ncbi:hypothetical protein F0562_015261 [Nyssa sinensis]|uniref:DOG1 domain-containing protein n=1 Tax=Nyssa sinensis TaxID=561372 RepID=A0A5J4ZJS1_9ASTE|nr:hypothetical protein F0562_015261 [Nyssa sinensis]
MPLGTNVGTTRTNNNFSSFEFFLEGWLVRQEHYLDELLSAQQRCQESRDEDLKDLITRCQKMNQLIDETKKEERVLADKLARIQESVAAPPMLEMARQSSGVRDREIRVVDAVLETLRSAMESVVINADLLRITTAEKVVEMLSPVQNVKFLAAVTQLQLKIWMWGLQKETERCNKGVMNSI